MEELKNRIHRIVYTQKTDEIIQFLKDYELYLGKDLPYNYFHFVDYLLFMKQEMEHDFAFNLDNVYLDIIEMMNYHQKIKN